jgi:hypothetical protein
VAAVDYGRVFEWLGEQAETPERWHEALVTIKAFL